MKAYIQIKSKDTSKPWEEVEQCEIKGFKSEKNSREFAKSLANHLSKNVRLVLNHKDGNGIYYSPKLK